MTDSVQDIQDQLCKIQEDQRKRFFFHEAGDPSSRFNVISPYITNSLGELIYTPAELDMRRKCEILKYKSNTKINENTKANKYSYLSKKKKNQKINQECNIALPTTASNVPGPVIFLKEDSAVPLYKYYRESQQFKFQNIPFDDFKRILDSFPIFNVSAQNQQQVNIMDLVILNPDDTNFLFSFSIPISIKFSAYFTESDSTSSVSSSVVSIFSALMEIYYSSDLIKEIEVPFRSNPSLSSDIRESTQILSIDLNSSVTGNVSCTQYIGNIIINDIDLITVTQYVYTLFMTLSTTYAEYSNDPDDTSAIRSSVGSNVDNSTAENLTNVTYGFIINMDNSDPNLFSSSENCNISIYNENNDINVDDIQYIDYNLSFKVN